MIFSLAWAALRRHPFSVSCTALLAVLSASLLGTPAPLALGMWATTALVSLTVWHALEPVILHRLGCRSPSPLERQHLDSAMCRSRVDIVVLDVAQPWLGRGLRSLVVSRALIDLLAHAGRSPGLNTAFVPGANS